MNHLLLEMFHHNLTCLFWHKCLNLYHHFFIVKKLQIIVVYDDTCLFIVTVYQVSEQKFIFYCLHFDNTPDIIYIIILKFQLRIFRGKQHLERKFKCTQKVWIQKFSKSKYKNQYFFFSKQSIVCDRSVLHSLLLML